ncbi:MAG TPA: trypsin-like serine protease, partial [Candidatus Campbellbacteria bacterium]|nr:trypsin-like serine protease [Candidatus Campbellbacteria bacterium]
MAGFWVSQLSTGRISLSGFNKKISQQYNNVKQPASPRAENAVVAVAEKVSPAVVSIIITKNLPKYKQYYANPFGNDNFFKQFFGNQPFNFGIPQYKKNGTEKKEIGEGSGFIVSKDGYIVTNKHVVADEDAEYTVVTNKGKKYTAKVLAKDPSNDIAIIKIKGENFPTVELGDSSSLKIGQTAIAIGNALGEFHNTVSVGVISGLSRSITAGGSGFGSEHLAGVIQTDASINPGNSGGPLLDITGKAVGVNTATVQGAQNIGFAIPINEVASAFKSVEKKGRIIRPWLGVRYITINKDIAEKNKLSVDYGALITRGEKRSDLAVIPGSPADKADLRENDIILEINGKKISENYTLAQAISKFSAGDKIKMKILHKGK